MPQGLITLYIICKIQWNNQKIITKKYLYVGISWDTGIIYTETLCTASSVRGNVKYVPFIISGI
jgi:hypothetical protein